MDGSHALVEGMCGGAMGRLLPRCCSPLGARGLCRAGLDKRKLGQGQGSRRALSEYRRCMLALVVVVSEARARGLSS